MDQEQKKEYSIGDKKYFLKPLVLGQWQQLIRFLKGKKLPERLSPTGILESLGDDLFEGFAIVLCEDGRPLKDKKISDLATEIQFSILPDQAMDIIEDFFVLNPMADLLKRLAGRIGQIAEKLLTGSMKSASSSPEETSPSGTKSSGDTP